MENLGLSGLDGNNGFRLIGNAPYDHVGISVSGAGDVNGDGFDDVIVSASHSSYVVFGRSDFTGGNVIEGTPGDDNLKGTTAAEVFETGVMAMTG